MRRYLPGAGAGAGAGAEGAAGTADLGAKSTFGGSAIAFSSRPKLSLGGILHPEIGEPTPHGRANTRVMLGLIAWMRAHAAEIPGFDGSLPVLPQLPLLDDDQLRAAFRSMDPLAR